MRDGAGSNTSADGSAAPERLLRGDHLTIGACWADNLDITEEAMAQRIPSNIFIARAVPTNQGTFHALFSAPGLIPNIDQDRSGRAREYGTEEEAENAALRALISVLNKPRLNARKSKGKPERYEKMSNVEFAVALQEAGLTPTFFAFLYGTSQSRVIQWIDGTEDIPHPARLLLAIFRDNEHAVDIAEQVTESVTTSRRPERTEA